MQVAPSAERPFPTPPTPNAPELESARFANRGTVVLPDEMVTRILMYLGTTDIAVCRSVNRQWQTVIDARHLLARSFYRDCHHTQRINSLAAERNLTVERYHSLIRGWLRGFSNSGRETAKQLDNILKDKHFHEVLFFSIPRLLLNSNELTCRNIATIGHLGVVRDASFSPDGKYLLTVFNHNFYNHAKLWELEGGQWREKVILSHSLCVTAKRDSFSPDGKHLVTLSNDNAAKLWELEGGQWREKVTLRHSAGMMSASFSPDGDHLVTASSDGICKIWRLEDDQWQEKVIIEYSGWFFTNAQFSPDGKHLVVASVRGIVKIWKLDDGQWEEKFTIQHRDSVTHTRSSPDGKHLVTVTSGVISGGFHFHHAKLWELVDNQSQEKATIEHSAIVNDVHFSPDGKHFVTASRDGTVKICGPIDGKWQVKAKIQHFVPVANASFSRDGKLLVTASREGTAKICGLKGGKWQIKATIWHGAEVTNASFGPDYQIVTASRDKTAKIWLLKNKENDDNS